MQEDTVSRRSLIVGMGTAVAGFAVGATTACAQTPATQESAAGFAPTRHELDRWLDELPGQHRVFVDSATAPGGAQALLYSNNLYTAQENAYSGAPSDFAMVVCFRHLSTPFGYNDEVWSRYGEVFQGMMQFSDPGTGGAPAINLMNSADYPMLPNMGNTIDSVIARGTQFAICNAATQFFAGQIASASGGSAEAIYEELIAGAIPNSRFVSAGVIALTRAQEYGYSLLYAG
jgi:hypothetical protein